MENLIIQILSNLIQGIFISYYFISLSNNKDIKTKRTFILATVSIFLTMAITNFINLKRYSTILHTLLCTTTLIIIDRFLIKFPVLKSILSTILYYVLMAITEFIAYYIINTTLNIPLEELFPATPKFLLFIILQHVFATTFMIIFNTFIMKKYDLHSLNFKQIKLLLVMIGIFILPQFLLFPFIRYSYPLPLMIINVFQILLVSILIFNYMRKIIKEEKTELELINTEIHNNALIETVDGIKKLKHDYGNIVQALNGYVVTKNYDKMHEYVNSLIREFSDINSISLMDPKIFNEPAIYGVVGAKYFSASEENIPFEIEITSNIKDINFSKPELSRIFGILLDNAIEAVRKADKKYIKLEIHHNNIKNADVIRILNSFDTTNKPDLDKIYEKGVSTKKVKSGIGLWEVKKMVNKTKNSQIYATIEGDKFVQNLIIEE